MKSQFEGAHGRARLIHALGDQTIVRHDEAIATAIADAGELLEVRAGEMIAKQDEPGADFFFILEGSFEVVVKGNQLAVRKYGDHIGEIAALDPGQKRAATVRATEPSVVCKLPGETLRTLGREHPRLLEGIAIEANRRLAQRNDRETECNERPCVLAISAKEGLPVVREIESLLREDDLRFRPWDQGGVFSISSYPIPSLEQAMAEADFALVIATPVDKTITRGKTRATPRDNVTFEMGMAIGGVGLDRTIIVTPSDRTDLASDLNGVTVARYRTDKELGEALRPLTHDIRKHISQRGPRTR